MEREWRDVSFDSELASSSARIGLNPRNYRHPLPE